MTKLCIQEENYFGLFLTNTMRGLYVIYSIYFMYNRQAES